MAGPGVGWGGGVGGSGGGDAYKSTVISLLIQVQ